MRQILKTSFLFVITLLLEETKATTNEKSEKILGFNPKIHWKESIDLQIEEMQGNHKGKMKMNKP